MKKITKKLYIFFAMKTDIKKVYFFIFAKQLMLGRDHETRSKAARVSSLAARRARRGWPGPETRPQAARIYLAHHTRARARWPGP